MTNQTESHMFRVVFTYSSYLKNNEFDVYIDKTCSTVIHGNLKDVIQFLESINGKQTIKLVSITVLS